MTVANSVSRIEYVGNGSTVDYHYPWRLLAPSDIVAFEDDVRRLDITVTGGSTDSGGTVTFATPPLASARVWLIRNTPRTQPVDLHEYGVLSAETQEREYDRLTLLIQEIQAQLDRAIQFSPTAHITGISVAMPLPGADQFIKWNAAGDALETAFVTGGGGGGGGVSGSGLAGQVAIWSGPTGIFGDTALTWAATQNTLSIGSLPQGPLAAGHLVVGLAGPSTAEGMQAVLVQTYQGAPGLAGLVTLGDDRVGVSSWNFRGTGATNPIYGANFGVVYNTPGVANGLEIDVQNKSDTNFIGQALWLNGSTSPGVVGHRANAILIDTQDSSKWERGILFKEGFIGGGATGSILTIGIHFEQSQDADFIVMQPRVGTGANVAMKLTDPAFTLNRFELLNNGTVRSNTAMTGASFPAFAFTDSIANGMYLDSANTLGFSSAGLRRVTIGAALNVYPLAATPNNTGTLNLWDQFSAHSVGLMAADFIGNSFRIRLPAVPGTAGQQLITSGLVGGIETWSYASPVSGGPGSGTVTNSTVLTLNQLVFGDGGAVVKAPLGLGLGTQVLHGNSGGLPTWAQVAIADIAATGTPSATTFLRGDGQWSAGAVGGTVSTTGSPAAGQVPFFTSGTVLGADPHFLWDNAGKKFIVGLANDVTSTSKVATFSGKSIGFSDPVVQMQATFAGASPTVNFPVALALLGDFPGGTQMPIGFGVMMQLATHDYAGAGTSIANAAIWSTTTSITPQSADLWLGSMQAGTLTPWVNFTNGQALFTRTVRSEITSAVSAVGGNLIAARNYQSSAFAVDQQVGNVRFTAEATLPLIASELATISGTIDGLGGTRVKGRLTFHTSDGGALNEWLRIASDGRISAVGATTITSPNQATAALSTAGTATLTLVDSLGAGGNGGTILFGAFNVQAGKFAAIKGLLRDGASNQKGDLAFSTRTAPTDATLTQRLLISETGIAAFPTAFSGNFDFASTGTVRSTVRFFTNGNASAVSFIAPATSAGSPTWTLPSALGGANTVLTNDGTGTLSWGTAGGAVTGLPGSVFFADTGGGVTQANTAFFYNNALSQLRLGTGPFATATSSIYVASTNVQSARFERNEPLVSPGTNNAPTVHELTHTTTGDMTDGFGVRQQFTIRDSAGIDNTIARLVARRAGNDLTGAFAIQTNIDGATNDRFVINGAGQATYFPPNETVASFQFAAFATRRTEVQFFTNNNSNAVTFVAPATATGNHVWTLPSTFGVTGDVLTNTGAGILAWSGAAGWTSPLIITGASPQLSFVDTTASAKGLDLFVDANVAFFRATTSGVVNRLPTFNLVNETTGIGGNGGAGAALNVDGTYLATGANPQMAILMQRNDASGTSRDFYGGQSIVYNNNTGVNGEAVGHIGVCYAGPGAVASSSAIDAELFQHATATFGQANGINIAIHTARASTGTDYFNDVRGLQIITYFDFASNYTNYPGAPAWGPPADVPVGHGIFLSGQQGFLHYITALGATGAGGGIFAGPLKFQVTGAGSIFAAGTLTLPALGGAGNRKLCIDNNGTVYTVAAAGGTSC